MESETITNTRMPSGITVDIESIPTNTLSKSTSSESGDGYFTTNGKLSYIRIGLIITILLFLGVNIFSYLGNFLQHTKEFFAPFFKNILESLGYVVTESTKDVTMLTAEGAKLGIDVAAGTIESGIDVIQGQLDIENPNKYREQQQSGQQQSGQSQSGQQQSGQSPFKELSASLSSALSDAEEKAEPLPDDAMSSTQRSSSGKAGYCYIGEDRGFRSCIEVKEWDTCMSGEIFPSNAICVNPSLRE
jgi:hypothetical protein